LYRYFARNRYRWFGRRGTCIAPTAATRERFLS
jgi:predicted DCC family thiol-disulfide oxidoreductase YuxK